MAAASARNCARNVRESRRPAEFLATDKPKVPGTVVQKGTRIIAPSARGVGRGVSPRPQPQTGLASFQASGFPDDSGLIVPSERTLDFLYVHREASRFNEPFGRPAQIILHSFAM